MMYHVCSRTTGYLVVESVRTLESKDERATDRKDCAVLEVLQDDINRAVKILKEGGCTEIYLFGSGVTGKVRNGSDIDLAVRGCPQRHFFHLLGRLLWDLDYPVDLVDLDAPEAFARYLQKEGMLLRVG